jgi:hypothetical protein
LSPPCSCSELKHSCGTVTKTTHLQLVAYVVST